MPVTVQHDVVVRDRLLIPPGWDSWGFIRVTREGFDVEAVSAEWGQALDAFQQQQAMAPEGGPGAETTDAPDTNVQPTPSPEPTVLTSYAEVIPDPTASRYQPSGPATPANAIDVPALDTQLFLAQQLEALTKLQAADDAEAARAAKAGPSPGDGRASPGVLSNSIGGGTGGSGGGSGSGSAVISGRGFGSERLGRSAALGAGAEGTETGAGAGAGAAIERQIGPVRGNLGGISVEAEDEGGEAGRAGEVGAEAGSGTGIGSGIGMWRNGAAAAAREPDLREMDLFFKDLLRRKESYGGAGAAGTSGGAGAGAGVEG